MFFSLFLSCCPFWICISLIAFFCPLDWFLISVYIPSTVPCIGFSFPSIPSVVLFFLDLRFPLSILCCCLLFTSLHNFFQFHFFVHPVPYIFTLSGSFSLGFLYRIIDTIWNTNFQVWFKTIVIKISACLSILVLCPSDSSQ